VIRLALRVCREDAELVLADLLELAPSGVEEVELEGGAIEYAVYGAPGELPALPDLRAVIGEKPVAVSSSEVPEDWDERWKQFHRPVLVECPVGDEASVGKASVGDAAVGNALVGDAAVGKASVGDASVVGASSSVAALRVRPPWEPPSERRNAREIVIDPGQAFGTGSHATTHLCLELLLELAASGERHGSRRGSVIDLGTGSGVLAIAAARLGFAPVLALDHDRESVLAAAHNAVVNSVSVEVRRFDLRREPLPMVEGVAVQTVIANLLRPLLLEFACSLQCPPRDLVVGGLLKEEADEVALAFKDRLGLCEHKRRERGEWAAMWLRL
jgi:ribosomal protein L11 methyltransferase